MGVNRGINLSFGFIENSRASEGQAGRLPYFTGGAQRRPTNKKRIAA